MLKLLWDVFTTYLCVFKVQPVSNIWLKKANGCEASVHVMNSCPRTATTLWPLWLPSGSRWTLCPRRTFNQNHADVGLLQNQPQLDSAVFQIVLPPGENQVQVWWCLWVHVDMLTPMEGSEVFSSVWTFICDVIALMTNLRRSSDCVVFIWTGWGTLWRTRPVFTPTLRTTGRMFPPQWTGCWGAIAASPASTSMGLKRSWKDSWEWDVSTVSVCLFFCLSPAELWFLSPEGRWREDRNRLRSGLWSRDRQDHQASAAASVPDCGPGGRDTGVFGQGQVLPGGRGETGGELHLLRSAGLCTGGRTVWRHLDPVGYWWVWNWTCCVVDPVGSVQISRFWEFDLRN